MQSCSRRQTLKDRRARRIHIARADRHDHIAAPRRPRDHACSRADRAGVGHLRVFDLLGELARAQAAVGILARRVGLAEKYFVDARKAGPEALK